MPDENKRNLQYFESTSMRGLYECMEDWQNENNKRLLSVSIQCDGGKYYCIAPTNPTEVIICNGVSGDQASVMDGELSVCDFC